MADYLPYAMPGDAVTFQADGALIGGQLVEVGAADMDAKAAGTASVKVVGVAGHDAADNTPVTVYGRGIIHRVQAVGAITRGDFVTADASVVAGRVKTLVAAGTAWRADAGIALESIADAAFGRVMFP